MGEMASTIALVDSSPSLARRGLALMPSRKAVFLFRLDASTEIENINFHIIECIRDLNSNIGL